MSYSFKHTLAGPLSRPCGATGGPLFDESEVQSLVDSARSIATRIAPLSAGVQMRLLEAIDSTASPLHFRSGQVLDSLAAVGIAPSDVVAVVPRAWAIDFQEEDLGVATRQSLRLRPTVLVATIDALHWADSEGGPSGWSEIPLDGESDDVIPAWSELFGRGPLAAFSNADLGLAASDGAIELFDLFLVQELVLPSTLYAFMGVEPDLLIASRTGASTTAYEAAGIDAGQATRISQIQDALRLTRERHPEQAGFIDDLFALGGMLLPFMVQGGFHAFLPLGLDPHGRGAFRYSEMRQPAEQAGLECSRIDPAGQPMGAICGRRGATLPIFIEATGLASGSYMDLLLASIRAAKSRRNVEGASRQGGHDGSVDVCIAEDGSVEPVQGASTVAGSLTRDEGREVERWARRQSVERAVEAFEDPAEKLKAVDRLLQQDPQNAEAHLARARLLRNSGGDPADALASALEAVRLDPSPMKYWIAALANADRGDDGERDRLIAQGRSLWTKSDELRELWERSSYFEATRFCSTGDRLNAGEELTEAELTRYQRLLARALKLMPETKPDEDAHLRVADIAVSNQLGDRPPWLLTVAQDLLRTHHGQPDANVGMAWYYYLCFLRDFVGDVPVGALQAAGDYLDPELLQQFQASG